MLLGLGRARAHAASSPIHSASSSRIGAPCAANTTGMRPACSCRWSSVRIAMPVAVAVAVATPRAASPRSSQDGARAPPSAGLLAQPDLPHELLVVPEQVLRIHDALAVPVPDRRHADPVGLAGRRDGL